MKPRNPQPLTINQKLITLSLFFLFVLYVLLKSPRYPSFLYTCNKIPPYISHSLIHYATTDIKPQQTMEEISLTLSVLEKKAPCNFLVFGLGLDSLLWASLNYKGRTVFLENSEGWMESVKKQMPSLEMYLVAYDTKIDQAEGLLDTFKNSDTCRVVGDPRSSKCPLAIKNFPKEVYETVWDLIMVDAPNGYTAGTPGRMKVIYTVGLLAKNRIDGETDVFVHDINRTVEDKYSRALLCEAYRKEEVGMLRHFTIPTHRATNRPFCP